jgi:hypothetical protein
MRTQVPLVFSLAIMVIGLCVALYSYKQISLARGSINWRTVPAEILSSKVKVSQQEAEKKRTYTVYSANISFRYTVNGQEFTSNHAMVDQPAKTFSRDAEALVAKFPPGKTVMAHYDPANPSYAILETGASKSSYIAFLFGILLMTIGMVFFGFRMLSAPRVVHVGVVY